VYRYVAGTRPRALTYAAGGAFTGAGVAAYYYGRDGRTQLHCTVFPFIFFIAQLYTLTVRYRHVFVPI
jgi:hypothetical protein